METLTYIVFLFLILEVRFIEREKGKESGGERVFHLLVDSHRLEN